MTFVDHESNTILTALIGAIGPVATVLLMWRNQFLQARRREAKLDQVHSLVNSRLTEALEEIQRLQSLVIQLETKLPIVTK